MSKILKFLHHLDKVLLYTTIFSIIILVYLIFTTSLSFAKLPNQIPLFYSMPWGETQLANKNYIFLLPGILFLFHILNFFVSWQLHDSQKILKRLIYGANTVIDLLLLIACLKIISIFI